LRWEGVKIVMKEKSTTTGKVDWGMVIGGIFFIGLGILSTTSIVTNPSWKELWWLPATLGIFAIFWGFARSKRHSSDVELSDEAVVESRIELINWAKKAGTKIGTTIYIPNHLGSDFNYPATAALVAGEPYGVGIVFSGEKGELGINMMVFKNKTELNEIIEGITKSDVGKNVIIRNNPGKYIRPGEGAQVNRNDIAWHENGILFTIYSSHYELNDLLEVAKSIEPVFY
jgi:hypothetical protein